MRKLKILLLLAGIGVCLLHLWWPWCFLTADGPAHTANARILHELMVHRNTEFYTRFYSVVRYPTPNWLSHIILALVMFVADGMVAEKIFLSLYMISFIAGCWSLLSRLAPGTWWPFMGFLFVFNFPLAMGFYNFDLAMVLFFFLVSRWIDWLNKSGWRSLIVFSLLAGLTYFAHPVPFVFGYTTCAALCLSICWQQQYRMRMLIKKLAVLSLCFMPWVILFIAFMRHEGASDPFNLNGIPARLLQVFRFNFMINNTLQAGVAGWFAGILLCGLLVAGAITKYRKKLPLTNNDGLLLAIFAPLFIFLFVPDIMFNGGYLQVRAQLFSYLLMVCAIPVLPLPKKLLNACGLLLPGGILFMSLYYLPATMAAADAASEQAAAGGLIKPYSIVLPLNYSKYGEDEGGNNIAEGAHIFTNAAQYLGADKPLILLNNYEARMKYFPLVWKPNVDPNVYLDGPTESILDIPPYGLPKEYCEKAGVFIDYIITWCHKPSFDTDRRFVRLYHEIDSGFHVIYRSRTGRTVLYERDR